jgi:hypothetical protein
VNHGIYAATARLLNFYIVDEGASHDQGDTGRDPDTGLCGRSGRLLINHHHHHSGQQRRCIDENVAEPGSNWIRRRWRWWQRGILTLSAASYLPLCSLSPTAPQQISRLCRAGERSFRPLVLTEEKAVATEAEAVAWAWACRTRPLVAQCNRAGPAETVQNVGVSPRFCRKSSSETAAVYERRQRVRQGGG